MTKITFSLHLVIIKMTWNVMIAKCNFVKEWTNLLSQHHCPVCVEIWNVLGCERAGVGHSGVWTVMRYRITEGSKPGSCVTWAPPRWTRFYYTGPVSHMVSGSLRSGRSEDVAPWKGFQPTRGKTRTPSSQSQSEQISRVLWRGNGRRGTRSHTLWSLPGNQREAPLHLRHCFAIELLKLLLLI